MTRISSNGATIDELLSLNFSYEKDIVKLALDEYNEKEDYERKIQRTKLLFLVGSPIIILAFVILHLLF